MKKFGLESTSSVRTPMSLNVKLTVDLLGKKEKVLIVLYIEA